MKINHLLPLALATALSGCVSFNETEYPQVVLPKAPAGKEVKVRVAGFDALITSYIPVYGYATVVGGDCWYGPHGRYYGGPFATTVTTETMVPQASPTSAFRDRATDALERCGFILNAIPPDYRVEVHFGGPFVSDGDSAETIAWNVLTLLTADYTAQTWTAKLKVYDGKTNKMLFFKDYAQKYEVTVWGPIPIFSPGASSKTKFNAVQSWCLTALTDLAIADAADFISKQPR